LAFAEDDEEASLTLQKSTTLGPSPALEASLTLETGTAVPSPAG
jgi:hypothetical protein